MLEIIHEKYGNLIKKNHERQNMSSPQTPSGHHPDSQGLQVTSPWDDIHVHLNPQSAIKVLEYLILPELVAGLPLEET